ncbi:protein O-mannosyl-transferase TMTC4 [Nematostella vectensis]|nr:protein O-mannosyl-transferase TMTC4 [Nematostella vectensis]
MARSNFARTVMRSSPSSSQLVPSRVTRIKQLVAVVSTLCFLNSLPGELVFDDHEVIATNLDVRPHSSLTSIFRNDFWGEPLDSNHSHKSYRPATILTFRLNYLIHGLQPLGYHVVNVGMHVAVSVLFVSACDVIFQGLTSSDSATLLAGLIFAIHPIHTEAVANVTGRADVQCALFYLLSFLSFTKCVQPSRTSNSPSKKSPGNIRAPHPSLHGSSRTNPSLHDGCRPASYSKPWMAACLLFTVVALLSKEQGVTVLAICVIYDVIYVCNVTMGTVKELMFCTERHKSSHTNKRWLPKWFRSLVERVIIISAFCIILLYIRIVIIGGGLPTSFVESDNPTYFHPDKWTRVRTYSFILAKNAWFLMVPSSLCYDWSMDSIPRVESMWDERNLISFGFLSSLMAFTLLALRLYHYTDEAKTSDADSNVANGETQAKHDFNKNTTKTAEQTQSVEEKTVKRLSAIAYSRNGRIVLFGLVMVVVPFLPASNLFVPVGFVIAERVLYIPSMGYCVLLSLGIRVTCGIMESASKDEEETNGAVSSNKQELKIKKSSSHEGSTLSFRLNWLGQVLVYTLLLTFAAKTVHRNSEWYDTGTLAASGLRVNPENAKIHLTMGNYFAKKGLLLCEKFYRQSIKLRPHYVTAWVNLGLVLVNTDREKEAESAYNIALSLKPNSADANTNMAHLLRVTNRHMEAIEQYKKAISLRPSDPMLHFQYGNVLEKLGLNKEAMESYIRTTAIVPTDGRPYLAIGRMLGHPLIKNAHPSEKSMRRAIHYLRTGLGLSPDEHSSRMLLAMLLLKSNEIDDARVELLQILTQDDKNMEAEYLLGLILERQGKRLEAMKLYMDVIRKDTSHVRALEGIQRLTEDHRSKSSEDHMGLKVEQGSRQK